MSDRNFTKTNHINKEFIDKNDDYKILKKVNSKNNNGNKFC